MRTAVISLTERGRELSARAAEVLGADRYCFYRHSDENARSFEKLAELTAELFGRYEGLVFICACGIAVREVGPLLRAKDRDPAVVVMDDGGRFAISLVSGHLGGANGLAGELAVRLGAQAVITTATDSRGLFSPDSFAKERGLTIGDLRAAKAAAAEIANGGKIGIAGSFEIRDIPPELGGAQDSRVGIYIGPEKDMRPFEVTLQLIPRCVTVGIGCKRGTPEEDIEKAVRAVFDEMGYDMRALESVASIDLKAHEEGLLDFCAKAGAELLTYSADELNSLEGEFSESDFVKSVTGVDCVCERSAVMSGGKLMIKKRKFDGVTAAAAVKKEVISIG
ncbi:MAG: cobalt-precorrin 5A hydrolase [Ruminococcus sp.]|nr:cobalt-precorrin 5A hydrolase [Ruminococcus sp.]